MHLRTEPGNALYEATVQYDARNNAKQPVITVIGSEFVATRASFCRWISTLFNTSTNSAMHRTVSSIRIISSPSGAFAPTSGTCAWTEKQHTFFVFRVPKKPVFSSFLNSAQVISKHLPWQPISPVYLRRVISDTCFVCDSLYRAFQGKRKCVSHVRVGL